MDSLPYLPLEKILRRLDLADLLACSLVSVSWRSMVNSDFIWKKICFKRYDIYSINYLQSVPSKVLPKFEVPVSRHRTLEPLPYWRIIFMKLQHVKRNWQNANHDVYKVTEFAHDHYDLKVDNNLLVAVVNDNQCEVWDIQQVPYKQETITCALKDTRCKCMIYLCDNKLVIVQDTLMQVYFKSEQTFKLCFRRLFNQVESYSETIPGSLYIDEWYNEQIKRRPTHLQAFHVGRYFIGVAENETFLRASFHIWDTLSGSKLKEQSVKEMSISNRDPVHNVKFCPPRSDLGKILVCVQRCHQLNFYTIIYVYDFKSLAFKELKVLSPHVPWVYYENDLIITIGHRQTELSIFDSSSGATRFYKEYANIINPESLQVRGEHLGFSSGRKLIVMGITNFEPVFTTDIFKLSSNHFGFDFVFVNSNLVLISQWDVRNNIEVWSIDKQCCLSTLKANGLMYPCNNYAKLFVWNEMLTSIYMLQFW